MQDAIQTAITKVVFMMSFPCVVHHVGWVDLRGPPGAGYHTHDAASRNLPANRWASKTRPTLLWSRPSGHVRPWHVWPAALDDPCGNPKSPNHCVAGSTVSPSSKQSPGAAPPRHVLPPDRSPDRTAGSARPGPCSSSAGCLSSGPCARLVGRRSREIPTTGIRAAAARRRPSALAES